MFAPPIKRAAPGGPVPRALMAKKPPGSTPTQATGTAAGVKTDSVANVHAPPRGRLAEYHLCVSNGTTTDDCVHAC